MRLITHHSGSTGNMYELRLSGGSLLIEAGVPIRQIKKATDFRLSEMSGCLITHEHGDHAKAAKDLHAAGVPIYCSKGTAEAIGVDAYIIEHGRQFRLAWAVIKPIATQHDCREPLGFLIADVGEKLLFATDTAYLEWRFSGLTQIAIECNWQAELVTPEHRPRLERSHMSLDAVLALLAANDLTRVHTIHLLHLSSRHADRERCKRAVEELTGIPVSIGGIDEKR